ncbi:hypothetical protein C0R19_03070 [Listeria monocytogenes]|nr:hypothetical protein [Listeria monocytogenes]PXC19600.1 hypothetical protein C9753_07175 [Listeria monocytogenes]
MSIVILKVFRQFAQFKQLTLLVGISTWSYIWTITRMEAYSKMKGQVYSQNSFIFIVFDYLINYSDKKSHFSCVLLSNSAKLKVIN